MLHLNPERSITEADSVPNSRAEHGDVRVAAYIRVDTDFQGPRFGYMTKAFLHQLANNSICSRIVVNARCQPVAARNNFSARNGAQSYGFDIAWFKAYSSAGWNIEPLSVRLATVKR